MRGCSDRGRWQVRVECQIETGGPVLQSGEQQHLHRIEADGAEPQGFRDGLFDLMLMEVLHQSKHLNELPPSGIAHARFHQTAQTVDAFGEFPIVQGAAWSSALLLCSSNAR